MSVSNENIVWVTINTYCARAVRIHAIESQHFYHAFWSGALCTYVMMHANVWLRGIYLWNWMHQICNIIINCCLSHVSQLQTSPNTILQGSWDEAIKFWWDQDCSPVLEFKCVHLFFFHGIAMMIEVCVLYYKLNWP